MPETNRLSCLRLNLDDLRNTSQDHSAQNEGPTRGKERRPRAIASLGLMFVEDEANIALCVEEEAILEDAFMVGRKASVEMPSETSSIYRHLR